MSSRGGVAVNLVLAAVLVTACCPSSGAATATLPPTVLRSPTITTPEHVEFQHNHLDTLDRIDPAFLRRVAQLALTLASTGWGDGPAPGE